MTERSAASIVDAVVDGLAVYRHPGSSPDAARVVLVHGSMDRAASFVKVARRLPDLDIVRYDRRGYGRSIDAGTAPTIAAQVDDLVAVLDRQPSAVVGHSLGGVIALAAALRRPDLVPSVGAFEAPMAWTEWWPNVSAGAAAVEASRHSSTADAAEQFMRRMIGDERWERLPRRTRDERRAEGDALLAELGAIRAEPPYDPSALLQPVTAGYGSESKPYHQDAARLLAELAPAGELVVIAGSGHAAQSSHPDDFARYVTRIVDRGRGGPAG